MVNVAPNADGQNILSHQNEYIIMKIDTFHDNEREIGRARERGERNCIRNMQNRLHIHTQYTHRFSGSDNISQSGNYFRFFTMLLVEQFLECIYSEYTHLNGP